jgi:hypothetical protein
MILIKPKYEFLLEHTKPWDPGFPPMLSMQNDHNPTTSREITSSQFKFVCIDGFRNAKEGLMSLLITSPTLSVKSNVASHVKV